MTLTRAEIDALRAEDGLEPTTDDTLARLFSDFEAIFTAPLFGQGQRIKMFEKEKS